MRRALPLVLAAGLAGCLIVPTAPRRIDRASRRPIRYGSIEALPPGVATRADVLLGLGGPDLSLDAERLLVYQWGTESGLLLTQYAAGSINATWNDLLFEFDEEGKLVRSGELRKLLAGGWVAARLRPATLPVELPVRIGLAGGWAGSLLLETDHLTVEQEGYRPCCSRIPRGGVERLNYRASRETPSWSTLRPWELEAVDEGGEAQHFALQMETRHLLALVAYLRDHSPAMTIEE